MDDEWVNGVFSELEGTLEVFQTLLFVDVISEAYTS